MWSNSAHAIQNFCLNAQQTATHDLYDEGTFLIAFQNLAAISTPVKRHCCGNGQNQDNALPSGMQWRDRKI